VLGNLYVATHIGIDIQPQQGCVDVVADASTLPFRDESFDIAISTETLEHIEGWYSAIT